MFHYILNWLNKAKFLQFRWLLAMNSFHVTRTTVHMLPYISNIFFSANTKVSLLRVY